MRRSRSKNAALFLVAFSSLLFAASEARADWSPRTTNFEDEYLPLIRGMGTDHYFGMRIVYMPNSFIDFEEDEDTPPISGTGYLQFSASLLPIPTLFGALGGLEADLSIGLPAGKSYFGGFGFNGGVVVQPLAFKHFRLSCAFGAGFNAHAYGYVKPRIAFTLVPDWVDAEASFRWIPEYASNVFGGKEDDLEDMGFGEKRIRGSIYIHVGKAKANESKIEPHNAIELSFDYIQVKGDLKELARVSLRPGDYLGFGLGFAM